jgi:hypothetical protein
MRVFSIKDPCFKTEPLFIIGCTHAQLDRYMRRRFHMSAGLDDQQCGQMFTFRQAPWRVVWVKTLPSNPATLGILLHEIVHLVTRILQDKGITIKAQTEDGIGDEPAAYLFEMFAVHAMRKLRCIHNRR